MPGRLGSENASSTSESLASQVHLDFILFLILAPYGVYGLDI